MPPLSKTAQLRAAIDKAKAEKIAAALGEKLPAKPPPKPAPKAAPPPKPKTAPSRPDLPPQGEEPAKAKKKRKKKPRKKPKPPANEKAAAMYWHRDRRMKKKGRLPDGTSMLVHYSAATKTWSGHISVPAKHGEDDRLTRQHFGADHTAEGVFRLISELDDKFREAHPEAVEVAVRKPKPETPTPTDGQDNAGSDGLAK